MSGPFEYIQQMKNMESRRKERQTSSNLAPKGLLRAQQSMPISYLKKKKQNKTKLIFPCLFPLWTTEGFSKRFQFLFDSVVAVDSIQRPLGVTGAFQMSENNK